MAATPLQTQTVDLAARFPGAVSVDARNGYTGWLVEKDKLLEIARAIKDELGYDLLTAFGARRVSIKEDDVAELTVERAAA